MQLQSPQYESKMRQRPSTMGLETEGLVLTQDRTRVPQHTHTTWEMKPC